MIATQDQHRPAVALTVRLDPKETQARHDCPKNK